MNNRILPVDDRFEEYLHDESCMFGTAESISFPESEEDILDIIKETAANNIPITIQGGRSGVVGGSIPMGGHVMNMTHMNRVLDFCRKDDGAYLITVESGISLSDLEKAISAASKDRHLFWPPAPSEPSATVGGSVSLNSKGVLAYTYGDTRKYVESLNYVTADGNICSVSRKENKELLEILVGSEGAAGVFSKVTLILLPLPDSIWSIVFFFKTDEEACAFIKRSSGLKNTEAFIAAVEYMDRSTIDMLEENNRYMSNIDSIAEIGKQFSSLVMMELHGKEGGVTMLAEALMEISSDCGSNPDSSWAASESTDVKRLRNYRHAAAEAANIMVSRISRNDKRITKLAADMTWKDKDLYSLLNMYQEGMKDSGLKGCIFGHAKALNLHVNLFPQNYKEYVNGELLIRKWTEAAVKNGGVPVTEHGIGKLKKKMLNGLFPKDITEPTFLLAKQFDPSGLWNRGS